MADREGDGETDEPADPVNDQLSEADKTASLRTPTSSRPSAGDRPRTEATIAGGGSRDSARAPLLHHVVKLQLPARLGRYTLVERLGVGGMAEVYRATQDGPADFTKTVVLKRILPHLAEDPHFVDMFLREARVAAGLTHSNIVQVYELGEEKEVYFIAMEYVDGLSVYDVARRSWRAKRSLPMAFAAHAVADAARGLHHAYFSHDNSGSPRHLVHRDISPDNLMVNGEGMTKLLDFGIAKGATSARVTRTGELKGKVPFMSPEQLHGFDLDHRSDLWALGVTLYWLLTGRRPFVGNSDLELMQAIVSHNPPPPSSINETVSAALDELVLDLLAKDVDDRPAQGEDVARRLLQAVPGDRTSVATFIAATRELPSIPGDAPQATTSGFLPSTPMTGFETRPGDLPGSARRTPSRVESQTDVPAPASSRRTLPVAAAFSVALIAAIAWGVSRGGDVTPATTVEVTPPASSTPLVAPSTQAPAPQPKPEPQAVEVAPVDRPDAPPVVEDGPAVEDEPAEPPPPESPPREPPPRDVQTNAPKEVSWVTPAGKKLGSGSLTLRVPGTLVRLVAVDERTGGRTMMNAKGSRVDWTTLGTGLLDARAFPFADVYVGKTKLGSTPLAPQPLVAGVYRVRLIHRGRTVSKTVEVKPGETARVKVNFEDE